MITLPNLDCDVTSVCNLACRECDRMVMPYRHSGASIPSTTPAQVEHDLYHFGKIAHTERWAALGGEPTLHKSLVDILRVVRNSGTADNIAVWSNGMRLRLMKADFWRAFDTLVVSAYPGKLTDADIVWIEAKCADEGVELTLKDERNAPNWSRILEPAQTDHATTLDKWNRCWFRTYSRTLNYGYLFTCCVSPHMPQLLQGREFGADGIAIEGLTEEGMAAFLDRSEPLGSCRSCAGIGNGLSNRVDWAEERDPRAWLGAS